MSIYYLFLPLVLSLAYGQLQYNPEFSAYGSSSVTIFDDTYRFPHSGIWGASIIDSNDDTTTYMIMPTVLRNGTKYPEESTMTLTIGPTTRIETATTHLDPPYSDFTMFGACSFSSAITAVCTSSLYGMLKPEDPLLTAGEGFPGGSWIRTSTVETAMSFQTYQIVVQITSIPDAEPTFTRSQETATLSSASEAQPPASSTAQSLASASSLSSISGEVVGRSTGGQAQITAGPALVIGVLAVVGAIL